MNSKHTFNSSLDSEELVEISKYYEKKKNKDFKKKRTSLKKMKMNQKNIKKIFF